MCKEGGIEPLRVYPPTDSKSVPRINEDQLHRCVPTNQENAEVRLADDKIKEACRSVHNGRVGHSGAAKTWRLLNTHYPGHQIPFKLVQEFVNTCPICIETLRPG